MVYAYVLEEDTIHQTRDRGSCLLVTIQNIRIQDLPVTV